MELDKNFQPGKIEQDWYRQWEVSGHFCPNLNPQAHSFCIQLPPPNITGTLHMGHAFGQTIMDGLIRYQRMKGSNTLWIPGTDHAGIATQIVVERQLSQQGISKTELGRENFIQKLWAWKKVSGNTIASQMRRIGCSVDWSKAYFTMDPTYVDNVLSVFMQLYQEGLIYRAKRLVNWDPVLGTAISDIEVENLEETGQMWYVRYPLLEQPDQYIVVATTRPETMLGDVAVAVHPDDPRYQSFIGKKLLLPLTDRAIPVIADMYVETTFGTGCVKVTPAHDFNDYEIGKRHHTDLINILTLDGKIRAKAEVFDCHHQTKSVYPIPRAYIGQSCEVARQKIVVDLQQAGCLVKTEPHQIKVPRGDRTGVVIEPMLTNQWFVAVNKAIDSDPQKRTLAQKAIQAVESGQVRFVPKNWTNTYGQWMQNIQDWCISRQLWWGHRIPAWYDKEGQVYVARDEQHAYAQYAAQLGLTDPQTAQPLSMAQLQQKGWMLKQDEDVLDTWFSSGILPFATLGWPKKTPEIDQFLPSSVLVTGYEILFFWVARMIMLTTHFTGKIPFRTVYIHGMVRDHDGKKMSKSEGNVIDPVDLLDGITLEDLLAKRTVGLRRPEKASQIVQATTKLFPEGIPDYGADALRFTMASYANLGRQVNFDFKRCRGYRNFCNKLWQATRFVLMHTKDQPITMSAQCINRTHWINQWMLSCLQSTIMDVTKALDNYRFDLAAKALYAFTWDEYCSWYLEFVKILFNHADATEQQATRYTMLLTLETLLRLMHPIMPFITEALWQDVAPRIQAKLTPFIMNASWPTAEQSFINEDALSKVTLLKEMTEAVRHLRGEMQIDPAQKIPLFIEGNHACDEYRPFLQTLARLSMITVVDKIPTQHHAPHILTNGMRLMLDVQVNQAMESIKLTKAISQLDKEIGLLTAKLKVLQQSPTPLSALVQQTQAQRVDRQNKKAVFIAQLAHLGKK
ncbi:MAG: valine--tRNA ligase [Neisseriales bacterium]|nr:MAG: valine--tRNA ligase [Neisseriales bacterium]